MDPVQYHHQDIQNGDTGPMDTTPILQHTKDLDPNFIPAPPGALPTSPVASQVMQQNAPPVFSTISDPPAMLAPPMHVPIPELSQPQAFINPTEVAPAPHVPPDPSTFLSELPIVDPFAMAPPIASTINLDLTCPCPLPNSSSGQVSSSSSHDIPSSYGVAVPSSLESALDQPSVTINRSRANTSVSPVSISPSYMSAPPAAAALPFIPPESTVARQEDVFPKAEAETVVAVENILER